MIGGRGLLLRIRLRLLCHRVYGRLLVSLRLLSWSELYGLVVVLSLEFVYFMAISLINNGFIYAVMLGPVVFYLSYKSRDDTLTRFFYSSQRWATPVHQPNAFLV